MTEAAQAVEWLAEQPEFQGPGSDLFTAGQRYVPSPGTTWAAYALDRWGRAPAARQYHRGITRIIVRHTRTNGVLLEEHEHDERILSAWGLWLWSLSQHLIRSQAPIMPKGAARAAVAAARELMQAIQRASEARGSVPFSTGTLTQVYAGLVGLDRWVKVPGLVPVMGDLWAAVTGPGKAAGQLLVRPEEEPATSDEAALLLAAAVPFDLLGDGDPLVRETLQRVERQGGIDAVDTGEALGILGWFYATLRKPGETVRCLERLEPIVTRALAGNGPMDSTEQRDRLLTEVALHLVLLREWKSLSAFIENWLKGER